MGLKERHEREREAVSRAILDAARDLFVAEGYPNVSIRKIAERIEYSPAAIYSYFPGKDDIFFALAEEGFRLLASSVKLDSQAPPVDVLRQALWELFRFSKSQPEYYALMFLDRSVPRISRDWQRFGFVHEMESRAAAEVQRAVDEGTFPAGTNPDVAVRVLVAAVMGVSVMRLCDRLAPGTDADALAHDVIETAIAGIRAGVSFQSRPVDCTVNCIHPE